MSLQALFHCIFMGGSWSPGTHKSRERQFLHMQLHLVLLGHMMGMCCWDHMLNFKTDIAKHRYAKAPKVRITVLQNKMLKSLADQHLKKNKTLKPAIKLSTTDYTGSSQLFITR